MITRLKIVIVLCLTGGFAVIGMYWQAQPDRDLRHGFNRNIYADGLSMTRVVQLSSSAYDFAGWLADRCYLRKVERPDQLIEIQRGLIIDTVGIRNSFGSSGSAEVQIDSPYFYWGNLHTYAVYKGHVSDWRISEEVSHPNFYSEFLPVSRYSVCYRTFDQDKTTYLLKKQSLDDTVDGSGLLQKQLDGLFCTDGMLRFDDETDRIVYTYFYRNEFICADTSLQLIYRGHTVDTITTARISVAYNEEENYHTLSSPSMIVNRGATCHNGKLFVSSNLMADNEQSDQFHNADVVDVYNLSTGNYVFSFYVPRYLGDRILRFTIFDDGMYAIYPYALVNYTFNASMGEMLGSMDP